MRRSGSRLVSVLLILVAPVALILGYAIGVSRSVETEDLRPALVTECRDSVIDRIALLNLIASDQFTDDELEAIRTLPAPCREETILFSLNPVTLDLLERSPVPTPEP